MPEAETPARKDTGNPMLVDAVIALNQNVVALPDRMAEKMAGVVAEIRARPSEPPAPAPVLPVRMHRNDLVLVAVAAPSVALFFFVALFMMGARIEVRVVKVEAPLSGVAHAQEH